MSADEQIVAIDADTSGKPLALAARRLVEERRTVLLDNLVALSPQGAFLQCDVIDPSPSMYRCENEYAVLVENARRVFEASTLYDLLPAMPCRWRVVASLDAGAESLWQAPKQVW